MDGKRRRRARPREASLIENMRIGKPLRGTGRPVLGTGPVGGKAPRVCRSSSARGVTVGSSGRAVAGPNQDLEWGARLESKIIPFSRRKMRSRQRGRNLSTSERLDGRRGRGGKGQERIGKTKGIEAQMWCFRPIPLTRLKIG